MKAWTTRGGSTVRIAAGPRRDGVPTTRLEVTGTAGALGVAIVDYIALAQMGRAMLERSEKIATAVAAANEIALIKWKKR